MSERIAFQRLADVPRAERVKAVRELLRREPWLDFDDQLELVMLAERPDPKAGAYVVRESNAA